MGSIHRIAADLLHLAGPAAAHRWLAAAADDALALADAGAEARTALPGPRRRDGGYLGRIALGGRVPLLVRTKAAGSRPAAAAAPPVADLYGPDGSVVLSVELPAVDPGSIAGLYGRAVRPGGGPGLGRYHVVYRYEVEGAAARMVEAFDLVAGDPAGAVIGLYALDRPEARYVVAQLDGGALVQGRNPRT